MNEKNVVLIPLVRSLFLMTLAVQNGIRTIFVLIPLVRSLFLIIGFEWLNVTNRYGVLIPLVRSLFLITEKCFEPINLSNKVLIPLVRSLFLILPHTISFIARSCNGIFAMFVSRWWYFLIFCLKNRIFSYFIHLKSLYYK